VEIRKTVLVVTDEADSTKKIAESISAELDGFQTLIRPADSFAGTDLLPACVFFLGCEKPEPPSFAYIADMLKHINLAGRSCGIFSSGGEALKYLAGLIKDCEALAAGPFLAKDGIVDPAALKKWVRGIVTGAAGESPKNSAGGKGKV
jgi:hypothetical protein